ncbi:anaerobic ribonucleoside-triphosphate reductase, partial [Bacillus cereus]|uniref:anaerobic ribonucleoside-triphosphate reductase n=1 Tax=Bacillus cereus TaxID=1396 RepID=UPI00284780E0
RYAYQCTTRARDFQLFYSQGVWRGGETLQPEDSVAAILTQWTLSFGFIGLAECFVAFTGQHHWEDVESWKLGSEIISFMRDS